MTVTLEATAPTLAIAATALGVSEAALDHSFGVVSLDPERKLYAVQVRSDAIPPSSTGEFRGPFADPRIEPF